MKNRLLLILSFMCLTTIVKAQDYTVDGNSIKITKVIENTNLSIDAENEVLLTYLGKSYNDINTTLKTNTSHSIVVKGMYGDVMNVSLGAWHIDLGHQIVISLKEGRVRVEVSVSQVHMYSSQTSVDHVITEYYPINPKSSSWKCNLNKSQGEELVNRAVALMMASISAIEEALRNQSEDDNW